MKSRYYIFFFILISIFSFSQNGKRIVEDENGKIVTNPIEQKRILNAKESVLNEQIHSFQKTVGVQNHIDLCSNVGFEEFITINGIPYVKDFNFYLTERSSLQCDAVMPPSNITNFNIPKYNFNTNVYATTVPSNYIDPYLGNIKSFDQHALKINYNGSQNAIVTTKRRKTANSFQFNYKVVMQTIMNTAHVGKQPYFKARIINQHGVIVDEFCLIADTQNCIYKRQPEGNDVFTLYTPEWRVGNLDISSIPYNEEFTIEFITARCGLGGHFCYVFIDNMTCAYKE